MFTNALSEVRPILVSSARTSFLLVTCSNGTRMTRAAKQQRQSRPAFALTRAYHAVHGCLYPSVLAVRRPKGLTTQQCFVG